jgi:2-polyprenyl-3-methyl-5-hydroxy-6-metoxy-1,4-benzoquinol methylase
MNTDKVKYLIRSAQRFFSSHDCPNCGSKDTIKVDQKYVVTSLYKCSNCKLQFRHPIDEQNFNKDFYQEAYQQDDGITTDLPSTEELQKLIDIDFKNSAKNISHFYDVFAAAMDMTSVKMVDYGCSWGYMSYQFKKRGIETQSFEISKPRARYGSKNLGLDIKTSPSELKPGNDIFFSSHVIEHVPSVADMIDTGKKLLKETGYFIAECPNGSTDFRKKNPSDFSKVWGLVHPSYIGDEYYQWVFRNNPYLIISSPYNLDEIRKWDQKTQHTGDTSGDQLLVIARPNITIR